MLHGIVIIWTITVIRNTVAKVKVLIIQVIVKVNRILVMVRKDYIVKNACMVRNAYKLKHPSHRDQRLP